MRLDVCEILSAYVLHDDGDLIDNRKSLLRLIRGVWGHRHSRNSLPKRAWICARYWGLLIRRGIDLPLTLWIIELNSLKWYVLDEEVLIDNRKYLLIRSVLGHRRKLQLSKSHDRARNTSPCRSRKLLVKRAWIRARYWELMCSTKMRI